MVKKEILEFFTPSREQNQDLCHQKLLQTLRCFAELVTVSTDCSPEELAEYAIELRMRRQPLSMKQYTEFLSIPPTWLRPGAWGT
jgi:hypothetical protein